MKAELTDVPAHGTEQFPHVVWPTDELDHEVEAMQGTCCLSAVMVVIAI